jgi:hypothetical protein
VLAQQRRAGQTAEAISDWPRGLGLTRTAEEQVAAGKRISGRLWQLLIDEHSLFESLALAASVEEDPLYREVLVAAQAAWECGANLFEAFSPYDFLFPACFLEALCTSQWTGSIENACEWACRELYCYDPSSSRSQLFHVAGLVQMWEQCGLISVAVRLDPTLSNSPDARQLVSLVQESGQTVYELMWQILRAGGLGATVAETQARIAALPDAADDLPF